MIKLFYFCVTMHQNPKRIVAKNLVILLKNVKQIKIRNAVLIKHSYLYLSPTP